MPDLLACRQRWVVKLERPRGGEIFMFGNGVLACDAARCYRFGMSNPLSVLPDGVSVPGPTFAEAFRFWLKLGFISFGGPAGQIAIMHEELVEKRRWIGEQRFLHALNFCMLLPGPEAQQLAIYSGWLLHGKRGGIVAGALFVLPSAVLLWALSYAYVVYGTLPMAGGVLAGLKLAVLAIVAAAAVRIGQRVLKNGIMVGLAVGSFGLIWGAVPFPAIVLGAAVIGLLGVRWWPEKFALRHETEPDKHSQVSDAKEVKSFHSALKSTLIGVLCWWLPVVLAGLWLGWKHTVFQEALFFSKAAIVTFGGAYAVLPYVGQEAVGSYGWLSQGQMMDGLGLAETTPGPLIMVLQFVGFLGGWQNPGALPPVAAATLGAALTSWVTFVPCFLWIFLGGPYVERLKTHRGLAGALSTITAAVVGVIASLAVHFGSDVIFVTRTTVDWLGLGLVIVGFTGLVRWKWGVIPIILAGASIGIVRRLAGF